MPPSKWNDDINWDDLRGQRLDYIIRSIYNATIERDYWYRVMSVDQFDPKSYVFDEIENNEFLNKNSHRELQVIYEIFERWLRPYTKIKTDYDGQVLDLYGLCVFIDEQAGTPDQTVVNTNTVWGHEKLYGVGNYDYTAGGNLSALVGYDLSFIETGYTYGTINGDHLRAFYNILNLNLKNRCTRIVWEGTGAFFRPKYFRVLPPRTGLFYGGIERLKSNNIIGDDYSGLVSAFNNNTYSVGSGGYGQTEDTYIFRRDNIAHTNALSSSYRGLFIQAGQLKGFNITDFETSTYYNIEETRNDPQNTPFDYTTDSPQSRKADNNNINIGGNDCIYGILPSDEIQVQNVGPVIFDLYGLRSITRHIYTQFFIDLNKEGFLSYYTEPTP